MSFESENYVVGFGSLLSDDSRRRFSDINCQAIPVVISGWRRAWMTRSLDEQQTHLSALVDEGASFNAALLPIEQISPQLIRREQDYEFVKVDSRQLSVAVNQPLLDFSYELANKNLWICQTKKSESASPNYPICQTYLDTCLAGCLEIGMRGFCLEFLQSTAGWDAGWINDRLAPRYPRAAIISHETQHLIDEMLADSNLLQHRHRD
jgi:hypothetical protein